MKIVADAGYFAADGFGGHSLFKLAYPALYVDRLDVFEGPRAYIQAEALNIAGKVVWCVFRVLTAA